MEGVTRIRVLTMNLWNRHGDWARRRAVLVDGLRELAPDVLVFQEAVVTGDYDQVTDLLGPGYHVRHQAGREADGSGCSMAARRPVERHEERHLRVTGRVAPRELTGRLACAEVAVPAPLGRCCRPTTNPRRGWAPSGSASCRRWRPPGTSTSGTPAGRCPALRIESCRRVFDRPVHGVWASDHFGVTADLTTIGGP